MTTLKKISADSVGVIPAYVRGQEEHGLSYFLWEDVYAVGAQCANCHTIIWQNPLTNPILAATKPAHIADSGPQYTAYYQQNIQRFLKSQPSCPQCGENHFDFFVNNVNFPRFADGAVLDEDTEVTIDEQPKAQIWWLE